MNTRKNMITFHCKADDPFVLYGLEHFIQKFGLSAKIESQISMACNGEVQNGLTVYVDEMEINDNNFRDLIYIDFDKEVEFLENRINIYFDIFKIVGYIFSGALENCAEDKKIKNLLLEIPIVDHYESKLFEFLIKTCEKNSPIHQKPFWPDGKKFAVCLTHDVDEIRKTYQYLTQAVRGLKDRRLSKTMYQLRSFFTDKIFRRNPYWTFEELMRLEEKLDVRSTFYFLKETAKVDIFKPSTWHHYARRYDFKEPDVASIIRKLSSSGWEIGLHGSYESYQDKEKLKYEKKELEDVLENKVSGIRQHHLNLKIPETWEYQEEAGFEYDTSLGFKGGKGIGFRWGTCFPFHPFNNGRMMSILEIPVTVMDISVTPDRNGWRRCLEVINTVEEYGGVLTLLWHHTVFNEKEYPGMRELYEKIISTCREKNGWITNASSIAKWWLKRELDGGGVEFVKSRT